MTIDWEEVAIKSGKFFLFVLEYCIKLAAVVVTAVALSTKGSFGVKLGAGFGSISISLRKLFEAPSDIVETANLIYAYNTLPAEVFEHHYGADAVHGIMVFLNGGISYLYTVSQNFVNQPFSTFFAALIAFSTLYMISFIVRFARQKGRGSYLNRLERKLGRYVFETNHKRSKPKPIKKPEKESSENGISFFGKSQQPNKHLKSYMKQAKNGWF